MDGQTDGWMDGQIVGWMCRFACCQYADRGMLMNANKQFWVGSQSTRCCAVRGPAPSYCVESLEMMVQM